LSPDSWTEWSPNLALHLNSNSCEKWKIECIEWEIVDRWTKCQPFLKIDESGNWNWLKKDEYVTAGISWNKCHHSCGSWDSYENCTSCSKEYLILPEDGGHWSWNKSNEYFDITTQIWLSCPPQCQSCDHFGRCTNSDPETVVSNCTESDTRPNWTRCDDRNALRGADGKCQCIQNYYQAHIAEVWHKSCIDLKLSKSWH